ncbi:MAG: aminopeptidase [Verrucomicrobia bacterium]|nr:aminopeptidase [Verrucomicrobiota bacterium]
MRDPRVDKWADVLVNYSLEAKSGERAVISADIEAMPLVEACYEKFLIANVYAELFLTYKGLSETLFKYGSDEIIATTPPGLRCAVEQCDLYLGIGADANLKLLTNVPLKKQSLAAQARSSIVTSLLQRYAAKQVRWVYTHFPTPGAAQEAEMGTKEYEEFICTLGFLNEANPIHHWEALSSKQKAIINFLETKKELHFKNGAGTDLHVNIESMKWVNCCGKINFPDGEVYTGPNLNAPDGGVNGIARFSFPTLYRNVEARDIELVFEKGAVTRAKASKGEDFLKEMISQDPGAKFAGEIAIGTNYHMQRITKNILYDEKFGGTFHLALGKGYPQTGNTNESALHWDIIFDLRQNGSITADGELFFKNGKFLT